MRVRLRSLTAIVLLGSAILVGCGTAERPAPPDPQRPADVKAAAPIEFASTGDIKISGPYSHDNLAIFLVHGEDRLKGRNFILLSEALEKKQFVIYETQNVNELSMENLSPSEEVLILSGDILKGGQQDRIAQHDQFVPPKSGKVPLTVFCVEHTAGRWMRKMTEEDKKFSSSPGQISTNSLRLANRHSMNQSEVWRNVAKAQESLSANARMDVKAKESDSSLALSLQAKEVQAAADRYVAKLLPVVEDRPEVVGFAFAINGKVYAADVYGSPGVFRKVWPRLLRASAIEAFADLQKDKSFEPATAAAVKKFLTEANTAQAETREVAKEIRQQTSVTDRIVRIETKTRAMAKDKAEAKKEETIRENFIAR